MRVLLLLLALCAITGCTYKEEQSGEDPSQFNVAVETPTPTVTQYSPLATPTTLPSKINRDTFHYGISVLYGYGGDRENTRQRVGMLLDYLLAREVSHVSINFPIFQADYQASEVYEDPLFTPTSESLGIFMDEANIREISVMLRPLLDEKSLLVDGRWKGNIEPRNREAWLKSYGSLVVKYAALAEKHQAESISVGAEFESMEQETNLWLEMINQAREVYSGEITYGVNWVDPFAISFAEALDFVSIDAYFILDADAGSDVNTVIDAWQHHLQKFTQAQEIYGKPFVITEIGIRSELTDFRESWHWGTLWGREAQVDMQTQAVFYEASCTALNPYVHGYYWWFIDLDLPQSPLTDPGWNPLGKPAENIMVNCYQNIKQTRR